MKKESFAVFKKNKSDWKMLTKYPKRKGTYEKCLFTEDGAKKFLKEIKDGNALATYRYGCPKHNPNAEYKIGKLVWELT